MEFFPQRPQAESALIISRTKVNTNIASLISYIYRLFATIQANIEPKLQEQSTDQTQFQT